MKTFVKPSVSIKPLALIPTQQGCIARFTLSVKDVQGPTLDPRTFLKVCSFKAKPATSHVWEPVLDVRYFSAQSDSDASSEPPVPLELSDAILVTGALMLPYKDCSVDISVTLPGPNSAMLPNSDGATTSCTFPVVWAYDFNAATEHPVNNKYSSWFKLHKAGKTELAAQREEMRALALQDPSGTTHTPNPIFSIVVPLYETPLNFLNDAVHSVLQQTYPHWELILVNASPNNEQLTQAVDSYVASDVRIKTIKMEANEGIVGNTNAGILAATGDFITFMDHDDMVEPNILFEYAKEIQRNPHTDFLYCDEDLFDRPGHFFAPLFKPNFNLDLLRTHNYITHMYAIRRELLEKLELPTKDLEGAQDYDLTFKATEQARHIAHISKVLYHWRAHGKSTNVAPDAKPYAEEAGRCAIQNHLDRVYPGCTVHVGALKNTYTVEYPVKGNPKVSIIIPNKDQAAYLKRCIDSVLEKAGHDNFEILIVENGSMEQATFELYKELEKRDARVQVITYVAENHTPPSDAASSQSNSANFNYSSLINAGVRQATGEYLLFLNNDTEVITEGFLRRLLGFALRPEVGIVGAKLLFADETIQHAGVGIQFSDLAAEPAFHLYAQLPKGTNGYHDRAIKTQDYSAVTGACQMTPRAVFDEVGGYDEELAVAFNDVDYCLKVIEASKLVVYCAEVECFHYESVSRGSDKAHAEKQERAAAERKLLQNRWASRYEAGDPYLNPNYNSTSPYCKPTYRLNLDVLPAYVKRIVHRALLSVQGALKKR